MANASTARFGIGHLVRHRLFGYRGAVYDVDPVFLGSEDWYNEVAKTRPPKDQPWYRVLVDGGQHETYVAERNLEEDGSGERISHPALEIMFESFEDGVYAPRRRTV